MTSRYVLSRTAATVGIMLLAAGAASAESMAGFEAGSLAGSMYDTQSNSQNTSQASTTNNTQSINQQTSQSTTQNTSFGGNEVDGGPLTNSRPGFINPGGVSTNTRNPSGNTSGMTGSPSMTMPMDASNNKSGGTGYNSPENRGAIEPRNSGDTSASNAMNSGTLVAPSKESSSRANASAGVTHTTTNIQRVPSHIPVAVVNSYKWSRTRRYNRPQSRTISSKYSRSVRVQ